MCIEIPSNIKTISIADTTTNEDYPFIHRMPRRPYQFYVHMDGQKNEYLCGHTPIKGLK